MWASVLALGSVDFLSASKILDSMVAREKVMESAD